RVTYWHRDFGFIEDNDKGNSYFFHRGDVSGSIDSIQLFVNVSYELKFISKGKFSGTYKANSVKVIETTPQEIKYQIRSFHPIVAKVIEWRGNSWLLNSPQVEERINIQLFPSRIIGYKGKIEKDQYLIVGPVNSTRSQNELF